MRVAIKDIPGVVDLEDDYDQGRPEIRVRVDKERAELLGLWPPWKSRWRSAPRSTA